MSRPTRHQHLIIQSSDSNSQIEGIVSAIKSRIENAYCSHGIEYKGLRISGSGANRAFIDDGIGTMIGELCLFSGIEAVTVDCREANREQLLKLFKKSSSIQTISVNDERFDRTDFIKPFSFRKSLAGLFGRLRHRPPTEAASDLSAPLLKHPG